MEHREHFAFLLFTVHIHAGRESKDDQGDHEKCNSGMGPCDEEPMPVKIYDRHAPQHADQPCPQGNLPCNGMPLPSENRLLLQM